MADAPNTFNPQGRSSVECHHCRTLHFWHWKTAFKYCESQILAQTETVAEVLQAAGYELKFDDSYEPAVIDSMMLDGNELLPEQGLRGDDPRAYLPAEVVSLLDAKFSGVAFQDLSYCRR